MDVQSVILVPAVSSAARDEFIERNCAYNSCLNIDRDELARPAHAQA